MITVAHSFGGVAVRHMDRTDATHKLGGIITVGSPLNGAGIATSMNNGYATEFGINATHQIFRGPSSSLSSVISANVHNGIGILRDILVTLFTQGNQSTRDMALGSSFITTDINASPTSTPKVSIYGNEVSPVHWNFFKSMWGKDVPTIAATVEDVYLAVSIVYGAIGVTQVVMGFWNPALWWNAYLNIWRATEWFAGYSWIHNSEREWDVLIGSNAPAPQQCNTYTGFVCSYSNNANFTNPSCWRTVTSCYTPQMLGKSDGFIACSSQRGLGSNSWAGVPTVEAFNVNHFSEHDKDNATMESKFTAIFRGDYGGYFQTDPR
jgi:hypothetical protein